MKKKKQQVVVNLYVDGSNVYGAQWELFGPKRYLDFASVIDTVEKIYPLKNVYFYTSYSPVPKKYLKKKPPNYILNERLFYHSVRKHPKVIFYTGHRSKTSGKEKGVDIHLGCDIVKHTLTGVVDHVILMSGDADFAYPIEIVKACKKKYSLFTFSNRISVDMIYLVKDYYVLKLEDKIVFPCLPKRFLLRLKVWDFSQEMLVKSVK